MSDWTEERIELLKKLWMEGLSASQIAGVLGEGVTRNSVIGKVHRLKLSGRAKPASAAPRVRSTNGPARRVRGPSYQRLHKARDSGNPAYVRESSVGIPLVLGAVAFAEDFVKTYVEPQVSELFIPVEERRVIMQLNEDTCKWPIGDPLSPDFYFCGQPAEDKRPYCEFHSRRAYHQIDKKKR